ncbi:MAG TPA: twin-arginine translocation signal domain-containing protein [Bryobacteraceae bacterium]|nr:twin-arginine translocation signal domain-containing protein [Bryobacteraceae bacterium]
MPTIPATRRDFLRGAALGTIALGTSAQSPTRILIEEAPDTGFQRRLAECELLRGLSGLGLRSEIRFATPGERPTAGDILVTLRVEPARSKNAEAYSISAARGAVSLTAASDQALLYAVFDFLERQGVFFGIDGESYPLDPVSALALPTENQPWTAEPRFAVRGLLPWPDFLNCITVYNQEDFRAYFSSMLRMRFNTFGMHVYTGADQWAESYLSFEFAGAGHLAFLDNTASHRWGYLPQRTSRFGMGAADFYDSEVFGSDSTRLARDPWETADRARKLLQDGFSFANSLGIHTGIGFEPYQIPDEIWRALPPEVKPQELPGRNSEGPRFDIESVTARKLLETRLGQLLEAYPDVEHVWLWEDEHMNWESRRTGQPFSVTPFLQAHDFLRRHAPKKRLVVGGWGGVARHFDDFHKRLPMDVIFTCLSDSLGWDPVHEVFGRLEGRERWPIPWLEDDPAMWLPQFHVHRFEMDLNRAAQFGCQGMIGIHWRHRIVDPTAAFQARFSWDPKLAPAAYYRAYARTQAAGSRVDRLADVLTDADKNRKLLSTFTGEFKDGHAVTREFSGDYGEAFAFWNDYEPDLAVAASQKEVASALRQLAGAAASDTEKERLEYLTRHVEFLVPYAEAWTLAHRLHGVLKQAGESKTAGRVDEARSKVRNEGVPLWMKLAPEVRAAMLHFQRIVANRNDLGTLASMQNKFVRLALYRLPLSIQDYLGEMPPEIESLREQMLRPDSEAPARLFLPTRPTLLRPGESLRIVILAPGGPPPESVALYTRVRGAREWLPVPAKLLGRRTWEATLGPFRASGSLIDYYARAGRLTTPFDAPRLFYTATLP